ncbi:MULTISPECIES: hypothetical protein [Streptomyces]|uniref:hypothetical protein n=1 Tax=Streptomyces TaxID=1883 RepID=UPI000262DDCE|nr:MULTISPECIES: hypothetical protein [Streptomyces]MYS95095.1 hypothetical protein [Streptomyces sp. SID5464]
MVQRQQIKKLPLRERIAAARRLAEGLDPELPDAPVTRERFRVEVQENIDTAGFHDQDPQRQAGDQVGPHPRMHHEARARAVAHHLEVNRTAAWGT